MKKKRQKIFLIDKSIEILPSTKLPTNGQILQRFFHLKDLESNCSKVSIRNVSKEVLHIWDKAHIPTIVLNGVIGRIERLVNQHKSICKNKKSESQSMRNRIHQFEIKLSELFDIAHPVIEPKNAEDRSFLELQRLPERIG